MLKAARIGERAEIGTGLIEPADRELVSDPLRTIGDRIRCSAIRDELPVTILTAPGTMPASWQALTIAAAQAGVSPAGLRMTEQPAANAAAILRAGNSAGKFHAENAATTPTGW